MEIKNTTAGNTYQIIGTEDTEIFKKIETIVNKELLVNVNRIDDMWVIYTGGSKTIIAGSVSEAIDRYVAKQ